MGPAQKQFFLNRRTSKANSFN